MRLAVTLAMALVSASSGAPAAPAFSGVKDALPAPGAAILRWDRAKPADGKATVTYRIYRKQPNGWDMKTPVAEVKGDEWVVTGLNANQPVEFIVRASDATGEEQNTRSVAVIPNANFPSEEWRTVYFSRFDWADGGRADIENRFRTAFAALADGNFNAVIVQVRGQGDTLFPSRDEPWSPMLNADARSSDPVKFAIAEARKNKLAFYAWINLSVVWQSANKTPPKDKNHPYYRFADASNPATRAGLIHDSKGQPLQYGSDSYVWLTSGNPDVNAYLRKQVTDFLDAYSVDGLVWDDRTGNPNGVSRDPISVARFSGRGNPHKIADFGDWQRDQLSRFLSDLYVAAKARHPRMMIIGAPFGIAEKQRFGIPRYRGFSDAEKFGVEPEKWLQKGILDVLTPQVYWDLPDPEPNYGTVVRDWVAHNKTGRPIWPSSAVGKYGDVQPVDPVQARYVAMLRGLGVQGHAIYNWKGNTADQWRSARQAMYPAKATVPIPAHMREPVGHVMGHVRTPDGKPVVDAWVRLAGKTSYIHLSSGDGFYAIPNLKAGSHEVEFTTGGGIQKRSVTVEPGKTAALDLILAP